MKKNTLPFKTIVERINIVDRFLLLFMLIFFLYMVLQFFIQQSPGEEASSIDIIIRTSAAAIFGYFVSSNFTKNPSSALPATDHQALPALDIQKTTTPENRALQQIGFQVTAPTPEVTPGNADSSIQGSHSACSIQIIIVASIGLTSLLILFLSRYCLEINDTFSATISQLRDFVSAAIGFLVSCAKTPKN